MEAPQATEATVQAPRQIIAAAVLATIPTILPGFLVGALSVQISDEFDVAEATYGWGIGGFFLAATVGSVALGRLAQHIGPRRQVTYALALSGLSQLFIALFVDSFGLLVFALAVSGLCNSANQTGINLLLSQAKLPRLGLAIALKQSGMPTASLLGGVAVPVIALTVGWRSRRLGSGSWRSRPGRSTPGSSVQAWSPGSRKAELVCC